MMKEIKYFGILNITPDSFSDGGRYLRHEEAVRRAAQLKDDGADIIDIGGDSTRPGSVCTGAEEEWRRIGGPLKSIAEFAAVSVDTHHAAVAEKAVQAGAVVVNDISCGSDPGMFPLVADTGVRIVLTCTCLSRPHVFGAGFSGDVVPQIREFLLRKADAARSSGVKDSQIILDPGMGAFLSADPAVSWQVIGRFGELLPGKFDLMLSASRKGFLRGENETSPEERDSLSALCAFVAAERGGAGMPDFLRVHNVKLHREFIKAGKTALFPRS